MRCLMVFYGSDADLFLDNATLVANGVVLIAKHTFYFAFLFLCPYAIIGMMISSIFDTPCASVAQAVSVSVSLS